MGCPDWPKCFGKWVPPTSVDELPENYKEHYSEYRHRKNIRFAKYLQAFGFGETASELVNDQSVREETDFNPVKTWIEYVNRLIGVIIGFLIFAVAAFSLRYWNSDRKLTFVALFCFLLVGFQGWLGSIVVSTNLTPWTITVHMFLALLIVLLLVYLAQTTRGQFDVRLKLIPAGWILSCMAVLLIQILWGTRVREAIDELSSGLPRNQWIDNLGIDFFRHRSFSWVVLILHVGLVTKLVKTQASKVFPLTLILLILGTILSGTGMAYLAVPPYLQPVHLLFATATFGILAFMLFETTSQRKTSLAK
jgi:cytochrome c oxidase assembly protein subunit 15